MPNAVIAHSPDGVFDLDALRAEAARWPGIDGMDLVPAVGATQRYDWDEASWTLEGGYGRRRETRFHVVAVDYGIKRNILRLLNDCGCAVTVVPATVSAEEILALKPDGVFLSNGPGDPAATGEYAVPTIQALLETRTPLFGICLGHQLLGLAVGGRTVKMPQGHHGANHPVKDFTTGKVEIVSMNHGFAAVERSSLPADAAETHVSLFERVGLRRRPHRPPGLLGAMSSRSFAGTPRQPLSFPPLRGPHRRVGKARRGRLSLPSREDEADTPPSITKEFPIFPKRVGGIPLAAFHSWAAGLARHERLGLAARGPGAAPRPPSRRGRPRARRACAGQALDDDCAHPSASDCVGCALVRPRLLAGPARADGGGPAASFMPFPRRAPRPWRGHKLSRRCS